MPGRYALHANLDEIMARFGAEPGHGGLWDWTPNYNISPGAVVPVIAWNKKRMRCVVPMRWGLHPHWKKSPPEGRPLFNARIESAREKPSFRTPYRRRRALIPANGWYEWDGVEKPKTPYYIRENDAEIFAFIGLWDQWRVDEGITLISCTVITTPATGEIKNLHHRMGVRLPEEYWEDWLNWDENPDKTLSRLKTGDDLIFHQVDMAVNSGRATGPDLIKKINSA